jgi:hypothetical protein
MKSREVTKENRIAKNKNAKMSLERRTNTAIDNVF